STKLLLPICDPADKTYNFFNCMATGAHAVANTACEKYFGCGKISLAQENALKIASREDMQARLAALPLERRLFDQAIPGSFINVAAMNSPLPIKSTNDVASLFQGVFSAVWSAPGRVASLAAAPAKAANADSSAIDGIDYVGIPLNTIRDTPLANEASQANGTCPTKPAGEINMCLADMSTIDALTARFTLNPALGG
ncbi:MAG TPA: hypothetical protein VLF43_02230, partial [Candidatus Saccharimonadales bacterium]|nr:hypothetical protein [Candidatus Saccharimonadales bacterium]